MRQAERRARTSERLLDAGQGEAFGRRGFHAATLDEVAAAAGYSKGAVYSNFTGKDALFLALLDRHLAAIERLEATTSAAELHAGLHAAAQDTSSTGSFGVLMLEFWLYAARDETAQGRARRAFPTHQGSARRPDPRPRRHRRRGVALAQDEAAALVLALDAGLFLQQLIDPDAVSARLRVATISDVVDPPPAEHRPGSDSARLFRRRRGPRISSDRGAGKWAICPTRWCRSISTSP